MSLNLIYLLSLSVNELLVGSNPLVNASPRTINQIFAYLKTPVGVFLSFFLSGCKSNGLNLLTKLFIPFFNLFFPRNPRAFFSGVQI